MKKIRMFSFHPSLFFRGDGGHPLIPREVPPIFQPLRNTNEARVGEELACIGELDGWVSSVVGDDAVNIEKLNIAIVQLEI